MPSGSHRQPEPRTSNPTSNLEPSTSNLAHAHSPHPQPPRRLPPADLVRHALAQAHAAPDHALRMAGRNPFLLDLPGRIQLRPARALLLRRAHAAAQSDRAAIDPAPADLSPRRAMGLGNRRQG